MDKKKWWLISGAAVLVTVALCLTVVSLLHGEDAPTDTEKKNLKIGLCLRQYEEAPLLGQNIKEAFMAAGYEVVLRDAMNDQSRQTDQIARLVEEKVDLLVIEPVITDGAEATVRLLMEKDVPGVFVAHKPAETALSMYNRLSFVGNADETLGTLQGQIILQTDRKGDLNEDGQVSCLIISGPEDDVLARTQEEACRNTLLEAGLLIQQLDTSWGDWTLESGRIRCAKALSRYGRDVEVIICGNEAITLGALEAIKAGGWEAGRDFCFVGTEGEDRLKTDSMTGTVVRDLEGLAGQVLSVAKELLDGGTVEKEYYVNLKVETGESASE